MSDQFVKKTSIPGLLVLERPFFSDERGFFHEVFHLDELEEVLGQPFKPLQWNHSRSKPRVLRGLHAENWNKLIYPVTGEVFVAVVDIRTDSETFGKMETFHFDEDNRAALFLPQGLANSFCVLGEEDANYLYLVDKYYDGSDTRAIAFDDPDLNIQWPIDDPIISDRDRFNPRIRDLFPEKYK
ncbi:dTDP-4-dehydrorhamnose 3,5-epimerase family protein [Candidatus Daviesbacteria bacterium]|nr:dTDP-4-dehydrorhamnose 3,5-epimerase family protein [Candidatus Daviesbacteria bacterium]